ncbi:Endo-1,4-beta-xylanase, GH35 family [Rhizobium sp. RU20A]|uniref:endo-1,4-beta-xylanase n=1 Tax=Rhizobium sp. RU20A TaxID=1907412 RepID=UPI0009553571|nr:endo-1,4-beta-xylanase [Rhizobium sp. RU20A]SIR11566.1 Endo-1,4-beta-xylanase, GH35 family [Rhizobium sp. RU20A]
MINNLSRREWLKTAALTSAGLMMEAQPIVAFSNTKLRENNCAPDGPKMIASVAKAAGITYGVAIQSDRRLGKIPPSGEETLADFIRAHSELYVPGIAFLPEHFQPKEGYFSTAMASAFIKRAEADNKQFRVHCMLYPGHDPSWVHSQLNKDNWREILDLHFDGIAAVPGVQQAVNIDVVNELMDANEVYTNGYRPNSWYKAAGGPEYITYAFKKARSLFKDTPLYWCHDHTEQITDGYHILQVRFMLNALERALKAGAPIDGYNMQGHLQFRLGFDERQLNNFLSDLTRNLGLKIIIGELDCRTGYVIGRQTDTRLPDQYSPSEYDQKAADLVKRFLGVSLPFVRDTGRQLITWGIADIDSSWGPGTAQNIPQNERPLPFDAKFRPKLMYAAMLAALGDQSEQKAN